MIKTHKLQKIFMQLYKINFTLLSQVKQLLKSDTIIAKNYLQEDEIKKLERTIGAYFDYIERLIENRQTLSMQDISESVNKFLEFNEFKILDTKGKISHIEAKEKAFKEYEEFNKVQKIESDFYKEMKKYPWKI
jgi:hypothetical protein